MATKEELEILWAKQPDAAKCKKAAINISAKVVDRIAKGFEDKKEKVPDNLRKKKFLGWWAPWRTTARGSPSSPTGAFSSASAEARQSHLHFFIAAKKG